MYWVISTFQREQPYYLYDFRTELDSRYWSRHAKDALKFTTYKRAAALASEIVKDRRQWEVIVYQ